MRLNIPSQFLFSCLLFCAWIAFFRPCPARADGILPIFIKPSALRLEQRWNQRDIERLKEVPRYSLKDGLTVVEYSYGSFRLLPLNDVPPTNGGRTYASVPSDEHHRSVHPARLKPAYFNSLDWMMTPVKNQGRRGTCHIFATIALMEALWKKWTFFHGTPYQVGGKTHHICLDIDLSEQWAHFAARRRAYAKADGYCTDGGNPFYDIETIEMLGGCVPEICWRYDTRPWSKNYHNAKPKRKGESYWKDSAQTKTGLPPASVVAHVTARTRNSFINAFRVRADRVHRLGGSSGVNIIKSQIISFHRPVVVSLNWAKAPMISNGCVLFVPDAIKDWSVRRILKDVVYPGGPSKWLGGGHAVLVCGVGKPGTPAEDLFKFKNSWSDHWGDHGYGYFTATYLRKFLAAVLTATPVR